MGSCWNCDIIKKSCRDYVPRVSSLNSLMMQTFSYLQESIFTVRCMHIDIQAYRHGHYYTSMCAALASIHHTRMIWPKKTEPALTALSSANQTGSQD